uniref:MAT1 centre domain-containing protein n=1 Tax=Gossypium raimondii TaxID=29730 RepID=A0A0D2SXJ5_GOSRA|nr:hypothetical protein B456_008G090500 [Gossypium raimondii]
MVVASSNPHNKEMQIRRRISNIFNKREEDFPSLREYNDYLEEVEDMIFKLIEGIDVQAIEEKITNYQQENAEQIMINQARKAEDLAAAMAASKGIPVQADTDGPELTSRVCSWYPRSICTDSCWRTATTNRHGTTTGTTCWWAGHAWLCS